MSCSGLAAGILAACMGFEVAAQQSHCASAPTDGNPVVIIEARSAAHGARLELSNTDGAWSGDTFDWSGWRALESTGGGEVLGWLGPGQIRFGSRFELSIGTTTQSGDQETQFYVASGPADFPPMDAQARTSGAFALMALEPSGAVLTGMGPHGGAFVAYVGYPEILFEGVTQVTVPPGEALETAEFVFPPSGGYEHVGIVSDMAMALEFSLTAQAAVTVSATLEVVPAEPFPVGDLNCDVLVNAFDIDPFVLVLTDPAAYAAAFPECDPQLADTNGDGAIDVFDIDPFVVLLTGGGRH